MKHTIDSTCCKARACNKCDMYRKKVEKIGNALEQMKAMQLDCDKIRADERERVLKAVIDSGWHCECHSDNALYEMVSEQLKEQKN